MRIASAVLAMRANRRREQTRVSLREGRKDLRSSAAVLARARKVWPIKTAVYLSDITGAPIRTCEYWLQTGNMPAEAVWSLLRSEHGMQFLLAGLDGAKPTWLTRILKLGAVASVMRRREADLRLIQKTLGADRDLTAALARATALSATDEEFHRPYVEALSAVGGTT